MTSAVASRQAPVSREAVSALRLCPNAILAGTALLSLLFVVWFGSVAALGFLVSGVALWARQPARAMADLLRFWPVHPRVGKVSENDAGLLEPDRSAPELPELAG